MPDSLVSPTTLVGQSDSHLCDAADAELTGARVHRDVVRPIVELKAAAEHEGFALTILSAFRDFPRQLSIWNRKVAGALPVLDSDGHPVDISTLSARDLVYSILRWSALPGASRHHWGTDLDVYDAGATPGGYEIQLIPAEVDTGGMHAPLHEWLDARITSGTAFGFYRPYDIDRGGVAPERWHLSHAPTAKEYARQLTPALLRATIAGAEMQLKDVVLYHLDDIYERFVINTNQPRTPPRAPLRPRSQWGTMPFPPDTYGRSFLDLPLEVWRPRGEGRCELLVFAGIHGEEPETTYALSRALRQLAEPLQHVAVVLAANPDGLMRGTRCNARGVDLNRNFPSRNWQPNPVTCRSTMEDPSDVVLGTGASAGSEPEVQALLSLITELKPRAVVALHAPLACIDDANDSALGRRLAERTGMPLVRDVGYPTPGSFGSWGQDNGVPVVTYEFPLAATEVLMRDHVPVLVELLTDPPLGGDR